MFVVFNTDSCSPLAWCDSVEEVEYELECRANLDNYLYECGRLSEGCDREYKVAFVDEYTHRCARYGGHCPFEYMWLSNAVTDPDPWDPPYLHGEYDEDIPF